jgi:hypothetical protein
MFSFVARVANESLSQVVIHNRWILLLSPYGRYLFATLVSFARACIERNAK